MADMEKVVKGLECHQIDKNHRINCADCPYYVDNDEHIRCVNDLNRDAIALLKEQPLRCESCSYHRKDGWCNEHGREVKETDYCSFGAWEGR